MLVLDRAQSEPMIAHHVHTPANEPDSKTKAHLGGRILAHDPESWADVRFRRDCAVLGLARADLHFSFREEAENRNEEATENVSTKALTSVGEGLDQCSCLATRAGNQRQSPVHAAVPSSSPAPAPVHVHVPFLCPAPSERPYL